MRHRHVSNRARKTQDTDKLSERAQHGMGYFRFVARTSKYLPLPPAIGVILTSPNSHEYQYQNIEGNIYNAKLSRWLLPKQSDNLTAPIVYGLINPLFRRILHGESGFLVTKRVVRKYLKAVNSVISVVGLINIVKRIDFHSFRMMTYESYLPCREFNLLNKAIRWLPREEGQSISSSHNQMHSLFELSREDANFECHFSVFRVQ